MSFRQWIARERKIMLLREVVRELASEEVTPSDIITQGAEEPSRAANLGTFLRLPLDIRQRIYELVLVPPSTFIRRPAPTDGSPVLDAAKAININIMLTSRHIAAEARKVLEKECMVFLREVSSIASRETQCMDTESVSNDDKTSMVGTQVLDVSQPSSKFNSRDNQCFHAFQHVVLEGHYEPDDLQNCARFEDSCIGKLAAQFAPMINEPTYLSQTQNLQLRFYGCSHPGCISANFGLMTDSLTSGNTENLVLHRTKLENLRDRVAESLGDPEIQASNSPSELMPLRVISLCCGDRAVVNEGNSYFALEMSKNCRQIEKPRMNYRYRARKRFIWVEGVRREKFSLRTGGEDCVCCWPHEFF